MAESSNLNQNAALWQQSVDEARAFARQRFKERLENGEQVGNCDCHTQHEAVSALGGEAALVVGVRFRDSSRVYFYQVENDQIETGAWVVVSTSRGIEAARVVIAPRQMLLNQMDGKLQSIQRELSAEDVEAMEQRRSLCAEIVKRTGTYVRDHNVRIKPVAAEFSFDGLRLTLSYSTSDSQQPQTESVQAWLTDAYGAQVTMQRVGPRDEARLIGGLGKCGRTLCCASWLPYYPDVSMGMAKNQDLSLNPGKVSGLCGRLLCCLSYENEQYRQAKRLLPRLGSQVATAEGPGMVISMQVLKELVTVRLENTNEVRTVPAAEILRDAAHATARPSHAGDDDAQADARRRRRRRATDQ